MGIISRKILPVCGNLCICCPEMRARSRQPVKRYKKLLSDIFPKPQRMSSVLNWLKCSNQRTLELQDEPPNDRKIGKLTEYASKNPLRIPKIAAGLEQRGCRALRSERYSPVRIVMRAYSKLLSSCRDQMPLFAPNVLTMIRILMEQAQSDFLQVLACLSLVDFLDNQRDCTYIRDLDALLPKICALSRETGEDSRRLRLRAAGLQSLASLINFMGTYSHMPADFDDIATVVLENYETSLLDQDMGSRETGETDQKRKGGLIVRGRYTVALMTRAVTRLQFHKGVPQCQESSDLTRLETEAPKMWSQVCIENIALLAKEATTMRRVLEPILRYFDAGKQWPPQKLALTVLRDMQHYMEKSGLASGLLMVK